MISRLFQNSVHIDHSEGAAEALRGTEDILHGATWLGSIWLQQSVTQAVGGGELAAHVLLIQVDYNTELERKTLLSPSSSQHLLALHCSLLQLQIWTSVGRAQPIVCHM
eukprot:2463026-Amphidinium_carterae.1